MPIPVNNNSNHDNSTVVMTIQKQQQDNHVTMTIQNVFIQIINEITSSRLVKKENCCLVEHARCCFSSLVIKKDENSSNIVINIIQKESNLLLERWIMSFDDIIMTTAKEEEERVRFIQNVTSFIRQMPAKTDFIEMYLIAILNNNNREQCHSYISTTQEENRIEFNSNAHLKAQRFHLPNLSLEVVYDDNTTQYYTIPKKPIISLQSLSSPSFMSWSKMQHERDVENNEVIHPLSIHSPIINNHNNKSTNNINTNMTVPIIAVRRLSRLSLSAIQDEEKEEIEEDISSTTNIPIPSPRMQYTHHGHHHSGHRTSVAYSTSPTNKNMITSSSFNSSFSPIIYDLPQHRRNSFTGEIHHGCLVGSFEESLFSGRMSSMPSKPITFHCQIGVLGYGDCKPSLKCPPHWSIVFPAMFYKLGEKEEQSSIPYVGTVDISEHVNTVIKKHNQPGYRIPPKGQLQVVIKNPNKTAVKLFLIPYDFTDMPKNTKTFLRQKSYTIDTPQQLLRYAIHIQVCRTEKKRIYLYKSMRIVFANRKADAREKFKVICEGPKQPAYMPL